MQASLMANAKSEPDRERKSEKQLKIVQSYCNLPFTKVASVATSFDHTYLTNRASLVAQTVKNLPAMQETQVQSLGREDLLVKEMANHSSILAWRIPRTEKPGGLQSTGSQRVRRDLSDLHFQDTLEPCCSGA